MHFIHMQRFVFWMMLAVFFVSSVFVLVDGHARMHWWSWIGDLLLCDFAAELISLPWLWMVVVRP